MIKRNNFTHRQKIFREDVRIAVREDEQGVLSFAVELDLSGYDLPQGSLIFLEAQRHTSFMRFACGTVGRFELPPADQRKLTDIVGVDGVIFRIKIVEPPTGASAERPARLIGLAAGIRPTVGEGGTAKSLLEIVPGDVAHEMWRLDFDESSAPLLRLDKPLYAQRTALLSSPWFRTMVLPSVFRAILTRIKLVDRFDDDDDAQSWQSKWIKVAQQLPGMSKAPPAEQIVAVDDWIGDAVAAFCRLNALREKFDVFWNEETSA